MGTDTPSENGKVVDVSGKRGKKVFLITKGDKKNRRTRLEKIEEHFGKSVSEGGEERQKTEKSVLTST